MSSLLSRKLIIRSCSTCVNKYQQTRTVCFPVIILGGTINGFCLTQLWNPYFSRSLLYSLHKIGTVLFLAGVLLPD